MLHVLCELGLSIVSFVVGCSLDIFACSLSFTYWCGWEFSDFAATNISGKMKMFWTISHSIPQIRASRASTAFVRLLVCVSLLDATRWEIFTVMSAKIEQHYVETRGIQKKSIFSLQNAKNRNFKIHNWKRNDCLTCFRNKG